MAVSSTCARIIAIVPAAGAGERAHCARVERRPGEFDSLDAVDPDSIPKQYRLLRGEPMLRWAVRALLADERIAQVRVIAAAGDARIARALAALPRTVWRFCGGRTRAATVLAALEDLAPEPDVWALVHDAARPGLPADALRRLVDVCLARDRGGLLARRVADTVKRQRSAGAFCDEVARSVARGGLWLAQTPQVFPARALLEALRAAAADPRVTDEASAMERAGYTPLLIPGSRRNFKVTWPEDFELMERWLG
ncbi:MAG: 2-C-methyl-D-erythritol 4-phosphate cytidylyltransferase [Candidimonas sp.]|nr:MAG: 2-C-methyl-D-erythritol 4-phosphate cytidylyltransferase [Candidimonas sp.]